jgi:hypothetical protein
MRTGASGVFKTLLHAVATRSFWRWRVRPTKIRLLQHLP